mmetsp:Transcript_27951/g.87064  ORF Transcript_27951/g.87064 Transcript_27951/m.87064 type:complete len:240 (-) Transcript_27951:685-1404(-)
MRLAGPARLPGVDGGTGDNAVEEGEASGGLPHSSSPNEQPLPLCSRQGPVGAAPFAPCNKPRQAFCEPCSTCLPSAAKHVSSSRSSRRANSALSVARTLRRAARSRAVMKLPGRSFSSAPTTSPRGSATRSPSCAPSAFNRKRTSAYMIKFCSFISRIWSALKTCGCCLADKYWEWVTWPLPCSSSMSRMSTMASLPSSFGKHWSPRDIFSSTLPKMATSKLSIMTEVTMTKTMKGASM